MTEQKQKKHTENGKKKQKNKDIPTKKNMYNDKNDDVDVDKNQT